MVRRGGGPHRLLTDADDARGKLEALAAEVRASGGAATAMFGDGANPDDVSRIVASVEQDIGPIHFVNCTVTPLARSSISRIWSSSVSVCTLFRVLHAAAVSHVRCG